MTEAITHSKVSGVANPGDGRVGGADWDDAHVITDPDWDVVIAKSADESVTSSTALQDDNDLFFTSVAGGYYIWEAYLIVQGNSAGDCKVAFGEDSTFRGWWHMVTSSAAGTIGTQTLGTRFSDVGTINTDVTNIYVTAIRGTLTGNGGTFKLQWAQNTSNGTATTVKQGSILRYKRIF